MGQEVITLKTGVNIYSKDALEKLKEAGILGKDIRNKLITQAVEGNTTEDIENLAEDLIEKSGGTPLFKGMYGYPYCTCVSNREQIVHGFPNNKKLKKGDVLSIDFGLRHKNGYCTDSARTVIIGEDGRSKHKELVKLAKEAFYQGFEKSIPGNTTSDIGHAVNKEVIKLRKDEDWDSGSSFKIFESFQGHGIGLDLHEAPNVPNKGKPGSGHPLIPGMCICIEPVIIYKSSKVLNISVKGVSQFYTSDRKPSSHYENQVFILNTGPVILT